MPRQSRYRHPQTYLFCLIDWKDISRYLSSIILFWFFLLRSHLPKSPSDLKQKCAQLPTSFLGTVFNALSHGATHFVRSVSFKNLKLEVSDWLLKFQPMRKRFLKLTLQTKWITPRERALKTVPQNDVGSCVHFCLRSLGLLERCDMWLNDKRLIINFKKKL